MEKPWNIYYQEKIKKELLANVYEEDIHTQMG